MILQVLLPYTYFRDLYIHNKIIVVDAAHSKCLGGTTLNPND